MAYRLETCILAAVAAMGIGALTYTEAFAQGVPCAPTPDIIERLKSQYNEVEIGGGIVSDQVVIVIYASPDGATWTQLAMQANGQSCVLATGENWFMGALPVAPAEGERPA